MEKKVKNVAGKDNITPKNSTTMGKLAKKKNAAEPKTYGKSGKGGA